MTEKRLLVFHQGALGDMVVLFPALLHLRDSYSAIHGICRSGIGELACRLGIFDRTFPIESARFSSLFADTMDSILETILNAYDGILLFSFSEALETSVRKECSCPVFRIPPRPDPPLRIHVAFHVARHLLEKGLSDGKLLSEFDREGRYVPKGEIRKRPPGSARVFLHFGSGSPLKNWPLPYFKAVYEKLVTMNMNPAFLSGPAERSMKAELEGWACVTPRDLIELSDLLGNADGFIGNDSGVTHLSAYLKLPTLAIFGPSDPIRWHPAGPCVRALVSELCSDFPCFETGRLSCNPCLTGIHPDSVVNAFRSFFL